MLILPPRPPLLPVYHLEATTWGKDIHLHLDAVKRYAVSHNGGAYDGERRDKNAIVTLGELGVKDVSQTIRLSQDWVVPNPVRQRDEPKGRRNYSLMYA